MRYDKHGNNITGRSPTTSSPPPTCRIVIAMHASRSNPVGRRAWPKAA
jgi:hypothetical protein